MGSAQSAGIPSAVAGIRSTAASRFTQRTPLSDAAALVVTDLGGNVRYMNYAASQMLKLTQEEAWGLFWRKCLNIIAESTRAPISDLVRVCLATDKTIQLDLSSVLVNSHDEALPVEGTVAPFCWLNNDVVGVVFMLKRVTRS